MYIDTHAHLNFNKFANDRDEVIRRALDAGVKAMICPSSNLENSRLAIKIAHKHPEVFAAIGFHPIHIKDAFRHAKFDEAEYLKLAKHEKVVALGETGLDYYYDKSSAKLQKEIFRKFLQMSHAVSKPVILHSRDAGEDVLSVLMEERPEPRGVMHCFPGDWPYAKVILDMGMYISFTGLITFTKNSNTYEVLQEVPLDRLLIETDCPYMTPEPYRGKRNEPAYVIEVAKKIAEIKKIPLEKVADQTSKNAMELFGLEIK